ncbi:hypothetical protein [Stenotrophomonas sp.]|uniref:hypothetical protein n=1 Tax=Stenotrophomonas sp. TaxID=69392 RepID=UPI0028AD5987|nr:hypothetical protein [Stenotrophomonas sp.]
MSINFKPSANTSFDEGSGVRISHPRILLDERLEGGASVEYQYTFRRGDERVGAMGFFGTAVDSEMDGKRGLIYTLDLRPSEILTDMLKFKRFLGDASDEFVFVRCLAQGLVNVFAGKTANSESRRYLVVASAEDLAQVGAPVPVGYLAPPDGNIVLAQLSVPGRAV